MQLNCGLSNLKSLTLQEWFVSSGDMQTETKLCKFPALPGLAYLHCCVPAMVPLLFLSDVISFYFSHLNYHEIQGNFYWSEAHLYIITQIITHLNASRDQEAEIL